MRSLVLILAAFALSSAGLVRAAELTPVGSWRTIDDKTGQPKSIVQIAADANGELTGKVVRILSTDKGPDPRCEECDGERKDKPILGMTILWGVKPHGEVWDGGSILDPSNGKTYGVKLTPTDGGEKLQVRGFLGISLLGRTQVWERASP